MFDEDTELGNVKLSIKFINKALAAKFNDTTIDPDIQQLPMAFLEE